MRRIFHSVSSVSLRLAVVLGCGAVIVPEASAEPIRYVTSSDVGRCGGHLSGPTGASLDATIDCVKRGGLTYHTCDHIQKYAWSIPPGDIVTPATQIPVVSGGGWVDTKGPVAEILPQPVPEPSMAVLFIVGFGAVGLRRFRR